MTIFESRLFFFTHFHLLRILCSLVLSSWMTNLYCTDYSTDLPRNYLKLNPILALNMMGLNPVEYVYDVISRHQAKICRLSLQFYNWKWRYNGWKCFNKWIMGRCADGAHSTSLSRIITLFIEDQRLSIKIPLPPLYLLKGFTFSVLLHSPPYNLAYSFSLGLYNFNPLLEL